MYTLLSDKLAVIFFSFLVFSCSNKDVNKPLPFNLTSYNDVDSKTVIDNQLNIPLSLSIYKDKLFVTDGSNQPSVFVFQIDKSGDVIPVKEFGREGRGPGEFLYPKAIIPIPQAEEGVYVYDAGIRKLAIVNKQLESEKQEFLFKINSLPIDIHTISDSLFISTGAQMESRFQILKINNNEIHEIESYGELISLGDQFSDMSMQVAAAWITQSTYNSELDRLALFSVNADLIELYNASDGELIRTLHDPESKTPKVTLNQSGELTFENNAVVSYIDVTSNKKNIYALYSGGGYGTEESSYGKYIHIFDWDMNFQAAYELDHNSLSIKVDENEGIYSIQHHPKVSIRYMDFAEK